MGRFLLFSDIHVHPHKKDQNRLRDCLEALDWVFRVANEQKVDAVLFGGDLLHDRQKIDTFTYYQVYKVLEKYKDSPFKTYLLVGNHDMWFNNNREVSSVMPFDAIKNIEVISKTCVKNIAGMNWHFLPYCHDPINELKAIADGCENAYLLGHISVDGAKLNTAGSIAEVVIEHDHDMTRVSADIFECYKRAFFGHYHCQQRLDTNKRIEYIGSTLQLTFGEAGDDKHIILVDSDSDSVEYIQNTFSPKHLKVTAEQLKEMTAEELSKNFVCCIADENTDMNELKKDMAKILKEGAAAIQVKKDFKKADEHTIKDAKSILQDEDKVLERYVEQITNLTLDKQKLIEMGHRIMRFGSEES